MVTIIEPENSVQTKTVINVTQADTPYTLRRDQLPCYIKNDTATSGCRVLLPTDCKGGEEVFAKVKWSQNIELDPGTTGVILAHDGTSYTALATGKAIIGDVAGEGIHLISTGPGTWDAVVQDDVGGAGQFSEEEA